jgi:hypothetical protein
VLSAVVEPALSWPSGADVAGGILEGRLDSAKDETIATLREQLEAERQAQAEARRLLMAALERIPQLEAPQETRESPETVEAEPERAMSRPTTVESQEGVERP